MTDIFVSYASDDRERVRSLVTALEGYGWRIWWDRQIQTGAMFDREIEKAIESSRCILVIWSHASVESEWVRTEANEGLDRGILVPVAIDNVRPPLAYRRVQTNLLTGWPDGSHQEELRRLNAALSKLLSPPEPAAAPVTEDARGERRTVSILTGRVTVRVAPSHVDLSHEVVHEFHQRTGELVARFGGLLYYQGGNRHIIVFGIPSALEGDALLATKLALLLRDTLKNLTANHTWLEGDELSTESSIVSGVVIARRQRQRSNDYLLTGALLEEGAALLGQALPNAIIASREAHAMVAHYVDAAEVTAGAGGYEIKSASAVTSRIQAAAAKGFTALCARGAELEHLASRYTAAAEGAGQVVTISGEAGVGKSRLLHEFRSRLAEGEVTQLEGHCHSYGGTTPYYPYLGLLQRFLQLAHASAHALHDTAVASILAVDESLEPYIGHYLYLLSIPSKTHTLPAHLEGEPMRLALQDAIVAMLTTAARRRPLVIALEDWHWADDASTATLHHLINVASSFPILLIVTCRPECPTAWGSYEHCTLLRPGNLSVRETGAMLASLTGGSRVPPELVADLHQRTSGNPFFLEEVCSSLLEQGKIKVEDGALAVQGNIEDLGIPGSVQAVLRTRLDQLDREAQEVVSCASVIGREFSRRLLEVTSGRMVDPILRGLVEMGIVKQTRVVPEPEYIFKHALTQLVAYDTMLLTARRRLHRLTAEAITKLHPDGVAERTELLAYHFTLSDDSDQAIRFTLLAGERALARSAHRAAVKQLRTAENLLAAKPDNEVYRPLRLRAALALGPALVVTDGYAVPAVIETYTAARDLSRTLGATEEEFAALWGLWRYCNASGSMERALLIAYQLRDLAVKSGQSDQLHSAYAALASSETFGGNVAPAREFCSLLKTTYRAEREPDLATRYGTSPMVVGLGIAAHADVYGGDYASGLALVDEAVAIGSQLRHPVSEVTALYYAAMVRTFGGQMREAHGFNQRMLALAEKERLPQWVALAKFNEARDAVVTAANPADRLEDLVVKADNAVRFVPSNLGLSRLLLSHVFLAFGKTARALGFIEEGLRGLRVTRPELLRLKAKALRSLDPAGAEAAWAEAWELAITMQGPLWQLRLLLDRIAWSTESGQRSPETLALIAPTLAKFSGALDTPDVTKARQLLASEAGCNMPAPADCQRSA